MFHAAVASTRRFTLPVIATSLSIGASMFIGDFACQYIQVRQQRKKLMQQWQQQQSLHQQLHPQQHHSTTQTQQLPSSSPLVSSSQPSSTVITLPPDFDAQLAFIPPAAGNEARVIALPRWLLDRAPRWWNSSRSMSMFATGALAGGPWQFILARGSEWAFPGRSVKAIAQKLAINMCTAPISISTTFYLVNWFGSAPSDPHTHDRAVARIRRDVGGTFVTGFVYWPFVSILNLRFVHVAYRPITGSMAGACWNIYVSSVANSAVDTVVTASTDGDHEDSDQPVHPLLPLSNQPAFIPSPDAALILPLPTAHSHSHSHQQSHNASASSSSTNS